MYTVSLNLQEEHVNREGISEGTKGAEDKSKEQQQLQQERAENIILI